LNASLEPSQLTDVDQTLDPAWALQPRDDPKRIHWLFREALRQHEIHPLMRLVHQHRQRGQASSQAAG
jgi:hypothetical protein